MNKTSALADNIANLPLMVGGGLAVGAGARLAKNLLQLIRDDEGVAAETNHLTPAVTGIPIKLSPEEAAEAERRGIKVRGAVKTAGPLNAAMLGFAGTGAALGGWALVDKLILNRQKAAAKERVDALRNRLKSVLNDDPSLDDAPLHLQMKQAEAAYFSKQANILDVLGYGVGGATALATALGLQQALENNKHRKRIKALQVALNKAPATPPRVVLDPVVEPAVATPAVS